MENNEYKHRMGCKKLILTSKDGNPLKNTEVVVEQKKHKFLFGCSEFSSLPFANGELEGEAKEKSQEVFKRFFDLFNYTTMPFYWEDFEHEKGHPNTEKMKKTAKWFKANGCTIKGHPLCWHTLAPSWLLNMSNSEIKSTLLKRIERDVTDFKDEIDIWDVINEAVIMPVFKKYDNGITRVCKETGRLQLIREVFAQAKKANPKASLMINDFVYTSLEAYDILIESCLEAGIPIDAIGIQSHMHQGYWGVEKTEEILEIYSRYNLPIHFTESTLVSGHCMPKEIVDFNDYKIDNWASTPEGEERQAREAVMHYKTLFKNPAVESITQWEFVDGQWLGAPVGLITQDNRVKPAYDELYKLIKGEWWTKPIHAVTDENGSIVISGFLGEYEVDSRGSKNRFLLDKGNADEAIKIILE